MKRRSLEIIRARELRKNATEAETALWTQLRYRKLGGYRFRRQRPIGRYIVDFVCLESQVVVELDGGQHQESGRYDAARTAELKNRGFAVVRFWNNQVFTEIDGLKEAILLALSRHSQATPPP